MLNIEQGPERQILDDNQNAFAGLPVAPHWTIRNPYFGLNTGLHPTKGEAEKAFGSMNGTREGKFVQELRIGQQYRTADGRPDDLHQYTHAGNDGTHGSERTRMTIFNPSRPPSFLTRVKQFLTLSLSIEAEEPQIVKDGKIHTVDIFLTDPQHPYISSEQLQITGRKVVINHALGTSRLPFFRRSQPI